MKKILLILLLFASFFASAQTYSNYTNINQRYQWEAGIFKALRIPVGDSAQFRAGQAQLSGSFYYDSTENSTPKGFYIWNGAIWELQGQPGAISQPNELLAGGTVTPLGGYRFAVQAAVYRIDNVIYASDSGTVVIDSSDATLNRIDRIYLSGDELIHVLEGELATNALEPQVESDQIGLAFITIPAGADPLLTTLVIYNENTESVVAPTGTTTDGNNTTNVYVGTKSVNVTNINNGDIILFTKSPSLSTWDILGFNGLSLFIKLKAVMPSAGSLRIRIEYPGGNSSEVIIPIDKANITTYQAITIASAGFGNIGNTQVTRVRIRYVRAGNTANYTGFYLDNMFFQTGVTQPTGNAVSHTLIIPGFTVSPQPTIGNVGTWNVNPQTGGSAGDYYSRAGTWTTFPTIINQIGTLDGRTKSADGAVIDGTEFFQQTVDGLGNPGLMTSAMFLKLDSTYWLTNLGDGDSLAMPIDPFTIGIKSFKGINGITIINTDSTITVDGSGVSGGGFFTSSSSSGATVQSLGNNDFQLNGTATGTIQLNLVEDGDNEQHITMGVPGQNISLTNKIFGLQSSVSLGAGSMSLSADLGYYAIINLPDSVSGTQSMVVWNSVTNQISKAPLPSNSGSVPTTRTISTTSPLTGGGDLSANRTFAINNAAADGSTKGAASFTAADFDASSGNISIDYTNGQAAATGAKGFLTSADWNTFNSKQAGDADLTTISGLTATTDNFLVSVSSAWASRTPSQVRTTLGLVVGTDVQAFDADLTTWAGITPGTGVGTFLATPSSANLASAITNETGSGALVFGTSPTFTTSILLAGPTSGNITLASDALANTAAGTNLSGTGKIPFVQTTRVLSDETLANSAADQNLFGAAHDVITVQANTTYQFYITGDFTHSAVAHSIALGFTPTTATVSSIEYNARAWVTAVGTATASGVHTRVKSTATTIINLSGANATESFEAWGTITIGNTGGTITPQIKFSVDPTGTILLKAGARMIIWAVGNDTFTVDGNIN